MKIFLNEAEYQFLKEFVTEKNIQDISFPEGNELYVDLDIPLADLLWNSLIDEVVFHFDEDYNPTDTGIIIESIIDKLYDNILK